MAARNLTVNKISRGSVCYVRFFGTVDETFAAAEMFGDITARDLIFNLKEVKRISSFGVREWVKALKDLGSRTDHISFVECSPAIVSQLNMVANFAANVSVVSVQIPYYCAACGWDKESTLNITGSFEKVVGSIPSVQCQRCKASMAMDDEVENYLAFVREAPQPLPSPELLAFIHDFETALDSSQSGPTTSADAVASVSPADPAPRVASPQGNDEDPRRVSAGLVSLMTTLLARRRLLVGVGAALLVAIVMLTYGLARSPEVDPVPTPSEGVGAVAPDADRQELRRLIDADQFDAAVALLDKGSEKPGGSAVNITEARSEIANAKKARAAQLVQEVKSQFETKHYAEAVAAGRRLESMAPLDADIRFVFAESLRLSGDLTAAVSYYRLISDETPDDPHWDDALYWQAEHLSATGKNSQARGLLKQVVGKSKKSTLKKLARRRLRDLSSR